MWVSDLRNAAYNYENPEKIDWRKAFRRNQQKRLWLRAMIRFRVWIFFCYSVVLKFNGLGLGFSYNFSRFSKVDGGFLIIYGGYLQRGYLT